MGRRAGERLDIDGVARSEDVGEQVIAVARIHEDVPARPSPVHHTVDVDLVATPVGKDAATMAAATTDARHGRNRTMLDVPLGAGRVPP